MKSAASAGTQSRGLATPADTRNPVLDRPRIRPGVAAARDAADPQVIVLYDELRISRRFVRVSHQEFTWLQWLDGANSLREVQALAMRSVGGALISIQPLLDLVGRLEEAAFLDGPSFEAIFTGPVREPACIGCYEGEPEALRNQLAGYFKGSGVGGQGSEKRVQNRSRGRLRAILAPHIDYGRGNATYAWAYRDLSSMTDANLFVIVGTSHYSGSRFTITRQDFRTPLGIAPVDQTYVDRLVEHYGEGLFDDPLAHIPEHSIELEVVWLQYLFEKRRQIRIVPLLVGSFHDCIHFRRDPATAPDLMRMVEALRSAESAAGESICYVISGDLAHIGPKFGDPEPVSESFLARSQLGDDEILSAAERADAGAYFRTVEAEQDRRRICGLPPTWTVLQAAQPTSGRLLHYGRFVHPQGFESVSFASMAFFA